MYPIKEADALSRWCPFSTSGPRLRNCTTRACLAWRFARTSALGGGVELVVDPKDTRECDELGVCVALPAVSVNVAIPRGLA